MQALLREKLIESRRAHAAITNIGARRAIARLACFFLEFADRMNQADLTKADEFDFPFNQNHVASAVGLSLVHTNKNCQALRKAGLISMEKRRLKILDYEAACSFAAYESARLRHLDRNESSIAA